MNVKIPKKYSVQFTVNKILYFFQKKMQNMSKNGQYCNDFLTYLIILKIYMFIKLIQFTLYGKKLDTLIFELN